LVRSQKSKMKLYKLFPSLLLKSTMPLAVSFATIAVLLSIPATAEELAKDKISKNISQLSDIEIPNTNAGTLVQTPTQDGNVITITGVRANSTAKGLEVILETKQGEQLQITNRSIGNNFIADITGGQLKLPNGDGFTYRSEKPTEGITEITVANIDANTIRLTVVGEKSLPAVELFDDDAGLVFAVASATTAAQPPQTPQTEEQPATQTPPEEPTAQQDQPIELVVTGEQDGYRVPNASTATKTDTPVRDIPGSIQVIPRRILEDQKTTRIQDALENISGVRKEGNLY
jgi:iron complex outermembrane receptor protein